MRDFPGRVENYQTLNSLAPMMKTVAETAWRTLALQCKGHKKRRAKKFVEELNSGSVAGAALPAGIVARYQMQKEDFTVTTGGGLSGGGATETYHAILFFKEDAAPPELQMIDRKIEPPDWENTF